MYLAVTQPTPPPLEQDIEAAGSLRKPAGVDGGGRQLAWEGADKPEVEWDPIAAATDEVQHGDTTEESDTEDEADLDAVQFMDSIRMALAPDPEAEAEVDPEAEAAPEPEPGTPPKDISVQGKTAFTTAQEGFVTVPTTTQLREDLTAALGQVTKHTYSTVDFSPLMLTEKVCG